MSVSCDWCHAMWKVGAVARRWIRRTFTAVALIVMASSWSELFGQTSVWGLQAPDQFIVETTIRKKHTITLGDGEPRTVESAEKLLVQYKVETLFAANTQLRATIVRAERTDETATLTDQQQLQLLVQEALLIDVDSSGMCRHIRGYENLIRTAAELRDAETKLLQRAYPKKCLMSWIERPFWMTPPAETAEEDTAWERFDHLSLGMMGILRTRVQLEPAAEEDGRTPVNFSGEGQLLPSAEPAGADTSERLLSFRDVTVTQSSFSGDGVMVRVDETSPDTPPRPWLDSLNLTWKVEGVTTIESSGKSTKLAFAHEQHQSSRLLPGYRVGRQQQGFQPRFGNPRDLFRPQ